MKKDALQEAELFIEKVVTPARAVRGSDPEQARARADLGRKELEAARHELVAAGLNPERLDKLAAERSKERKKLTEQTRRRAVEASAQAALHLKDLAPVILPAEPVETLINEMTFIRSFAGQGAVLESNIAPFDNWARYKLESSSAPPRASRPPQLFQAMAEPVGHGRDSDRSGQCGRKRASVVRSGGDGDVILVRREVRCESNGPGAHHSVEHGLERQYDRA